MRLRLFAVGALGCALLGALSARAEDPPGVADALSQLCSQHASATTVTFDRQMLDAILGGDHIAGFNSLSFQHYQYSEPAFYIPEEMQALEHAYHVAGWTHLVDSHVSPREATSPAKPIADLWFHWAGGEIDHVTVLIRGHRDMNVIEISGLLRPMDFVHLSGHFGIPKVDPNAVMVPAPPGR